MRFITSDGQQHSGRSYRDVVAHMASDKLREPRNLESYRRATARRIRAFYGYSIDTSSDDSFVKGLLDHGLMKRL